LLFLSLLALIAPFATFLSESFLISSFFYSFLPLPSPSLSLSPQYIQQSQLGTLGVSKEAPVGFQSIQLKFEVDTDADEVLLAKVLQVTERYCVIFQTLKTPPALSSSITKVSLPAE
jgi:hypothetical protein